MADGRLARRDTSLLVRLTKPLTDLMQRPFFFFTAFATTLSITLAAIAFTVLVVTVVLAVLLLGAFIDALRYAVRQEDALTDAQNNLEISNAQISSTQADLSTAQNEIVQLRGQLQIARDVASESDPSLEHTLAGLLRLEASIGEAQRHRMLAPTGNRWVVTEFELDETGFVVVRADPDGSDPATINQERLSLINGDGESTDLRPYDVASNPPAVQGACVAEQLPQELAQEVTLMGRTSPAGYRLVLRALQDPRFQVISSDDLRDLHVAVAASIEQIRGLMHGVR